MSEEDTLEDRIKAARKDIEEKEEKHMGTPLEESDDTKRGKQAASEFLGLIIAGVIVGIACDKFLGTAPLSLFFFIIVGFVGGIIRANGTINKK